MTISKLHIPKIYIEEVLPDFEHDNVVYSWKIKSRLPESKVDIILKERIQIDVSAYEDTVTECFIRISKAQFKPFEQETAANEIDYIKCVFIGLTSALEFFTDLLDLRYTYQDKGMEYLDFEQKVAQVMQDYGKDGFGMSMFEEAQMIRIADGAMILTDNIIEEYNLEKDKFYMIKIEEAFITSAKKI